MFNYVGTGVLMFLSESLIMAFYIKEVKEMWKHLKNKWDHLFDDEEELISSNEKIKNNDINKQLELQHHTFQRKSIETKVAYQYPKTHLHTETMDEVKPNKPNKRKETNNVASNQTTEEPKERKQKKPFKVSSVPSPIHGFQQKKQFKSDDDENVVLSNVMTSETEQVEEEKVLPNKIEQQLVDDEKVSRNQENHVTKELMANDEQVSELNNATEIMEKPAFERKREQETSTKKEPIFAQQPTKHTFKKPVNVMMTPRDKRRQWEKQQELNKPINRTHTESIHHTPVNTIVTKKIPYHLLNDAPMNQSEQSDWVKEQSDRLQLTMNHFHIQAKVVGATQGPSVTRFEIQPEPGVKVSKIKNLTDDIKLNLAAKDIRMEAPIPGKNTIGIEVPNEIAQPVYLQNMLESEAFQNPSSPLTVALGADIEGKPIVTDLQKMPHGLIAGATGSGKSVCINTMLISLLYKAHHDEVKFLLIDPKMVELTPYNDIPHLVAPVITDVKAATSALKWAVNEMEDRYKKFVQEGVRDLTRYNDKMTKANRIHERMPYLVIVIDELADLMMTSPQDVEDAICRIAQKARACGMHLLIATQRPSVDVITGLIKANVPTRIAFSVSSQVDSRTILDVAGAEKLLGKGDMLFVENGSGEMKRIQGAFVSDDEIERITHYVKQIAEPNYLFEQDQLIAQININEDVDELYEEAIAFVLEHNGASASLLQRRFKIGYNRAARLIDSMEESGIISGQNGSKPRDIIANRQEIDHILKG